MRTADDITLSTRTKTPDDRNGYVKILNDLFVTSREYGEIPPRVARPEDSQMQILLHRVQNRIVNGKTQARTSVGMLFR